MEPNAGPWTIEMLARNGEVLHRYRAARLPIRVGRAYDNDFIVDDDYAAAHHVEIDADPSGALVLRDLGSRNGVVHAGRRVQQVVMQGDTVVRMGHTSLRVRAAGFPVAPEMFDRTMHGWEGLLPGAAGVLLAALVALLVAWLLDAQPFELLYYVQAPAWGIGAALLWSSLWAFLNRLFGRHARLGRHLFIFGCGVAALVGVRLLASVVAYAGSFEWLTRYGSHAAVATVAGIIYFHLATIRPPLRRRLRALCAVAALVGSSLVLIANEQRHGRTADELYMPVLLPPQVRASPDATVADYMGSVAAMRAGIDAERAGHADEGGN
ncbi:FHA domain-containing protein [Telluria aromaticivorans]|uniref:FHA domain-containing protein n=1 Tax=Telluria aromaticivorans TaxID=2725995 RepID=A0A7Y2JW64_9BURK|nr:FHA domain-containing protein [Telluria aromaticivorans]NNG22156.1 FHA domain-containing protein [Telluria aromaticivorans]